MDVAHERLEVNVAHERLEVNEFEIGWIDGWVHRDRRDNVVSIIKIMLQISTAKGSSTDMLIKLGRCIRLNRKILILMKLKLIPNLDLNLKRK